jgi:hypothetical protein
MAQSLGANLSASWCSSHDVSDDTAGLSFNRNEPGAGESVNRQARRPQDQIASVTHNLIVL